MGGMHSWMWGYTFPEFVDALLPLASLPVQIAGRNRMIRRMLIDSIRLDRTWQKGEYAKQPWGLRAAIHALLIMISTPLQWQIQAPTQADADRLFDNMVAEFLAQLDANDLLYQVEASRDYDPSPHLERILAPLLAGEFGG